MKLIRTAGKTSQTVYIEILNSTSTTSAGLTGLVFNTSGLTAYYVRTLGSSTAITLATLSAVTSAYSSGGFKEIDATNQPGVYRFDIPNAVLATGADSAVIVLRGAANMVDCRLEIDLGASEAVWDVLNTGNTHNIANSAGKQLRSIAVGNDATIYPPSGTVTLASATSTTATLDAGASAVSQAYQWDVISILTGTGAGQSRIITSYSTGRVATVSPAWTTTPDSTSGYDITPTASAQVVSYAGGQDPGSLVLITAANKLSTDVSGRIDLGKILGMASAGAVGYVGIDWGAITNKTTTNALTGTTISTSQVVASVTGAVGSVGGAVASVTGSVGSVTGLTLTGGGVTLADGVAHGGTPGSSTATLAMAHLNVTSPSAAHAVIFKYSASDVSGNEGFHVESAAGAASHFTSTASSGPGFWLEGSASALQCSGSGANGTAISMTASGGAGNGLYIEGGDSGAAIHVVGPFTTPGPVVIIDATAADAGLDGGPGILIRTGAGDAVKLTAGGTTAHAINVAGGTVSGDALHLTATDGSGLHAAGGAGKPAIVPGSLGLGL